MTVRSRAGVALALCIGAFACAAADDDSAPMSAAGAGASGGAMAPPAMTGGMGAAPSTSVPTAGTTGAAGTPVAPAGGGSGGSTSAAGMGGAAGMMAMAGSGGSASAGSGGSAGSAAGSGGSMSDDAGTPMSNGSDLTGTLGALGAVKPVVNGWATTNGLETLIYLSSSPLTCAQMMTMGTPWLRSLPAGTQVIELVVRGEAMTGTTQVGFLQGEVNYAEGSKSSSTEVNASSGSIMFTKADMHKVYEGMVMATFPMGMLSGTFHADWCEGGAEY